jgi:hypothetical protein
MTISNLKDSDDAKVLSQAEKNTIEMVKLWELTQYEIVHDFLCHYRFTLSSGNSTVVGILELCGMRDGLIERGLYKKTIKQECSAKVLSFPSN